MSRSGYSDDCDGWELTAYRGRVANAVKGKRGQQFLKDLVAALDAMPEKSLIANELELNGEVCALGALGKIRGINMSALDPEEPQEIAEVFGIATCLAREVVYENDEGTWNDGEKPQDRWKRMRRWAEEQIRREAPHGTGE